MQMANHWGLDIPEDCLKEAFSRIAKEKMLEKLEAVGSHGHRRVSMRSKEAAIPAERKALIQRLIDEKLVFDFGYGFRNQAPDKSKRPI